MKEVLSTDRRLSAIRKRLRECKKDMTTFRDPWQAVTDMGYLLRRLERLLQRDRWHAEAGYRE